MVDESNAPPAASQPRSSLYANLLDSASSGTSTISRGPVVFSPSGARDGSQDDAAALKNTALRFQPTKRPTPAQKQKQKPAFSKLHANASSPPSDSVQTAAAAPSQPAPAPVKSTLADWAGDDDDINGFNAGAKRQRGGRKKRKKNKQETVVVQDWDDIYDPSRPNNYDDYRHSEEKFREIREWKDRLYAHRLNRRRASSDLSDDSNLAAHTSNRNFAPPPNYSFAPPPPTSYRDADDDDDMPPPPSEDLPPPPPPADLPNDATGDDAYARRMRLSGMASSAVPTPPPPPPPPPLDPSPTPPAQQPPQPSPAQPPPGTISRDPVRYQLPAAPADIPSSEAELEKALHEDELASKAAGNDNGSEKEEEDMDEEDDSTAQRSSRPGQRGFAARLMSKYGWTKGSGLGASGTGIVNPLRVQVEKRKKKSDAEGGGFVGPAGKGKIIGSKQGCAQGGDEAQTGDEVPAISEVVILRGMVDGLDLDAELGEGNLMQEIGEECAEKYGRVERVFIDRNSAGSVPVFVKFTSQLSALRAVQALEGRIFNGNAIQARYFDTEKFEAGIYE